MALRKIDRLRIQQGDIVVLALELAAARKNGYISTSDLKAAMASKFKPTAGDAVLIAGGDEPLFHQIVRNLISNRNKSSRSMFQMGYANYINEGIEITQLGRQFLDSVPR